MSNPWTPLHAALTLPKGPLTYDHIVLAVAAGVVEEAALDWKQELPQRGKIDETTKDIAAMANSGGGVIVYGVAESSGRAESVSHVSVNEAARVMILSAAASAQPMVQGMELRALPSSEGSEEGVVVAIVPGSPNAPHMVGQKHLYGAPVRNGPTTVWLDERSIERAYAERFSLRSSRKVLLESMVEDLKDRLHLPGKTWLLGVATPLAPTTTHNNDLSRQEVSEVLTASFRRSVQLTRNEDDIERPLARISRYAERLKVGRRRFIAETIFGEGPAKRSERAHTEIHHDGSLGLALSMDQSLETFRFGRPHVPLPKGENQELLEWAVETFCADLVSLAYEAMQRSQGAGAFGLRIETTHSGHQPFVLVGQYRIDGVLLDQSKIGQHHNGRTIPRVHPVESEILPSATQEDLLGIARSMALEILEQFGAESLHYLSVPTTD